MGHYLNGSNLSVPSSIQHVFLCHVEILDCLYARWSSRNYHGFSYLPDTPPTENKNKYLNVRGALFENNTPVDMSAISEFCHLFFISID